MGLIKFFDKLEDKTRYRLSKLPILYAIIGGIGIVLFWRGVWHTADYLMLRYVYVKFEGSSIDLSEAIWWDGPLSFLIGTVLLLMSGLFPPYRFNSNFECLSLTQVKVHLWIGGY